MIYTILFYRKTLISKNLSPFLRPMANIKEDARQGTLTLSCRIPTRLLISFIRELRVPLIVAVAFLISE